MVNYAEYISFLRFTLKLTQDKFAKRMGYSRSYVKNIETGKVKPSRRFLEALNENYGVSIDSLLGEMGDRVLKSLKRIPSLSGFGFVYIYDFTDSGLNEAEKQLLNFLQNRPFVFIDGKKIKSAKQLWETLTGESGSTRKLYEIFEAMCGDDYKYIIIKNFSLSGIREKAMELKWLAREIGPWGALIIIDKPSFLERNAEMFYYHAYPIHVDWMGKMHPPGEE